jgi:hypothetical protein
VELGWPGGLDFQASGRGRAGFARKGTRFARECKVPGTPSREGGLGESRVPATPSTQIAQEGGRGAGLAPPDSL